MASHGDSTSNFFRHHVLGPRRWSMMGHTLALQKFCPFLHNKTRKKNHLANISIPYLVFLIDLYRHSLIYMYLAVLRRMGLLGTTASYIDHHLYDNPASMTDFCSCFSLSFFLGTMTQAEISLAKCLRQNIVIVDHRKLRKVHYKKNGKSWA